MFEKYRQLSVGAWHSAIKFLDSPQNSRPMPRPYLIESNKARGKIVLEGFNATAK